MIERNAAVALCSVIGLISMGGVSNADDVLARYECSMIGPSVPEPIGDRPGHTLATVQFSCFAVDGAMKGAVYTATNVTEWDGSKGIYQFAGGVHRIAGGFAVTQLSEGSTTVMFKDGQPIGTEGSGKAVIKYATGTLAPYAGKPVRFVAKSTGLGRFNLDFTD